MSRQTIAFRSSIRSVRFGNGTAIEGLPAGSVATQLTPEKKGLRSAQLPSEIDTSPEFERALQELGIYEQETIHLDTAALSAGLGGRTPTPERVVLRPTVKIDPDAPRVVLYQDDSGGLSWHFDISANASIPAKTRVARRELRSARSMRPMPEFSIDLRTSCAQRTLRSGVPRGSLRGPITKLGRKIFKVLVLPLATNLLDRPVQKIAGVVEKKYRRNLIWPVTAQNYRKQPTAAFSDWASLRGQRVLLLVHGIFSSVEGMLSGLPASAMERWCQAYKGRVLAFNHLSVTQSPEDNARFFLQVVQDSLPREPIEFDILCHSRGGIVSRTLAERGAVLVPGTQCRFRSVFFVATPNQGSVLGNPEHMVDMLDVFTNFLTGFPDGPVMYSIEVLLGLVKLLASAGGHSLPGIRTMGTEDYIQKVLNAQTLPSPASYGAAGSDYEPQPGRDNGFLIDRFGDAAVDRIFEKDGQPVANDMVVSCDGVYAKNGHPSFPIKSPLLFRPSDSVWHSGFFSQPETISQIDRHLGLAAPGGLVMEDKTVAAPARFLIDDMFTETNLRPRRRTFRGRTEVIPKGRMTRSRAKPPGSKKSALTTQEVAVQRKPMIDFHESMREGETYDLMVRLEELRAAIKAEGLLDLAIAAGQDELKLTVELSAPGFDIQGARHAEMTIKRQRDPESEQAVFSLTAKSPGPEPLSREIIASFFDGNNCVGAVKHYTRVAPKDYKKPFAGDGRSFSDTVRISARPREGTDLVIYVRLVKGEKEFYEISMRCQVPGEEYESAPFGKIELGAAEMAKYFSDALDPSFNEFPGDESLTDQEFDRMVAKWNKGFLNTLNDLGKALWIRLPSEFRKEYFRLMLLPYPPRSICIHSDEMIFPWELVKPSETISKRYHELLPLGVGHVLGRWKTGLGARPQPQGLPMKRMAILNPRYGATDGQLVWSEKETNELPKIIKGFEVVSPVDRASVDRTLRRTDLQMVHFTGHGIWDPATNADLSALLLENDETIPAMSFAGNRLGSEAHPILFLNACTVGRIAQALGRPGGFAANCLDGGWSGVIAPYWPVYDPAALDFSLKLYTKLRQNRAVGEALQEIRAENPNNPTALSYSYFGDPWARMLFATPED